MEEGRAATGAGDGAGRAGARGVRSGTPIEEIGGDVRREADLLRGATLDGLPGRVVPAAFALDEGDAEILPTDEGGAATLRVDAVTEPGGAGEEAQAIKQGVSQAAGQGMAQDIVQAFTQAIERREGIWLEPLGGERGAVTVQLMQLIADFQTFYTPLRRAATRSCMPGSPPISTRRSR